jgi:hypothetical protein
VRTLLPTRLLHLGGDEVDMKCWEEAAKRTHSKQPNPLQRFQVCADQAQGPLRLNHRLVQVKAFLWTESTVKEALAAHA